MNATLRTLIFAYVIATIGGLMSNIVAGYLTATFDERRGLSVGIFALLVIVGLWTTLQQNAPDAVRHLWQQLRQLRFQAWWVLVNRWRSVQQNHSLVFTAFIIGLIAMAGIVWLFSPLVSTAWAQEAPYCPPDRICIAVAQIVSSNSQAASNVSADLLNEVRSVLAQTASPRYVVRSTSVVSNSNDAMQHAIQDGDLLLIWGEVLSDSRKVRIHYELLDPLNIGEATQARIYRTQPILYNPIEQTIECFSCSYFDVADSVTQRTRVVGFTVAGLVDYVQGRPEEARVAFAAALACGGEPIERSEFGTLTPDCPHSTPSQAWNPALLYYYWGKSLILQGEYGKGIAQLHQAAERNPQDPAAWISIGIAYQSWLAQPQAQSALSALQNANTAADKLLKSLPPSQWADTLYDLGLTHELLADLTGAQSYYQQAVDRFGQENPASYISLLSLARVQRLVGSDEAEKIANQALSLDPSAPWADLELARVHQKSRTLAEQNLSAAAQLAPNEAYVYITHAELCDVAWQDRSCAADAYANALKLRPDSGWLHSKVGDFYRPTNPVKPLQSWEDAQLRYRLAAQLRPSDPWAHERLGYVLFQQQTYSDAAKEYQQAIQLSYSDKEASSLYCSLSLAQERAGLTEEAKVSCQRCINDKAKGFVELDNGSNACDLK